MGYNPDTGLYTIEDIAFYNTSEITKVGKYFEQNKVYTKAPDGTKDYVEFWDREEDRLKNGMTIPGKLVRNEKGQLELQKIHITGKHYAYLNYAEIQKVVALEDDLSVIKKLSSRELANIKKAGKKLRGFPDFWDYDYHYYEAKRVARQLGLHIVLTKSRRKGYTMKEAHDSATTVNMNPYQNVGIAAYLEEFIIGTGRIFTIASGFLDFYEENTDFNRGYLQKTKDKVVTGYFEQASAIRKGFQSSLLAYTLHDNTEKLRGLDLVDIKLEECQTFPTLDKVLKGTLSTTEGGQYVTGQITAWGTAGTEESNWAAFEELCSSPAAFGFMAFDNIWDENRKGTPFAFFHPQTKNYEGHIDIHGNSLSSAIDAFALESEQKKKTSKSISAYRKWRSERATTPREVFDSAVDNLFDADLLLEQKTRIENDNAIKFLHRDGEIHIKNGVPTFVTNRELEELGRPTHPYIDQFPGVGGMDMYGCIREWFPPYKDSQGKVPKGLYRFWHDPYAANIDKKDVTLKHSLGSTFVYEIPNLLTGTGGDRIVAEFTGRRDSTDDYNAILLKMCMYWQIEEALQFENNRGDVVPFFRRKGGLHYLAKEPRFFDNIEETKDEEKLGYGITLEKGNVKKGTGVVYLKDWLESVKGFSSLYNRNLYVLESFYSRPAIQELSKWNNLGNFDRASALIIGMYDRYDIITKMELGELKPPTKEELQNQISFFDKDLF